MLAKEGERRGSEGQVGMGGPVCLHLFVNQTKRYGVVSICIPCGTVYGIILVGSVQHGVGVGGVIIYLF